MRSRKHAPSVSIGDAVIPNGTVRHAEPYAGKCAHWWGPYAPFVLRAESCRRCPATCMRDESGSIVEYEIPQPAPAAGRVTAK